MEIRQKKGNLRKQEKRIPVKKTRESKYPVELKRKGKFYCWGLRTIISRVVGFLWVGKFEGLENIPSDEPFIIVPNHSSFIDFMVVIHVLHKKEYVCFFIKKKYFDMKIWNFFLRHMGHIRADNGAIVKCLAVSAAGWPLILFAEGTRTRDGSVGDAYPGLAVIGERTNVLTIPMRIDGAFELWPWDKKYPNPFAGRCINVKFGKPKRCSDFASAKDFSAKIMEEIGDSDP